MHYSSNKKYENVKSFQNFRQIRLNSIKKALKIFCEGELKGFEDCLLHSVDRAEFNWN